MTLQDRLSGAFSMLFGRASDLQIIPRWMLGQPAQLPDVSIDWPRAYELVPDIYACISLIQSAIAELPLRFYIGEGEDRVEIERKPGTITDLWAKANDHETQYDLQEQLPGSLDIAGNAFLFMETFGANIPPRELHVLPPTRVRPQLDNLGMARAFLLDNGANGGSTLIPGDQVVWIKNYTPDIVASQGMGLSPLQALQQQYETQYDASRWQRQFFKRGGMVAGLFTTEQKLDPQMRKQTTADLRKQISSIEKSLDPVVLIGGLKYERSGLTQQDMQFIETAQLTTEAILRVFHIPPVVFGLKRGSALGDDAADTDWLMFYQQCIQPRCRRIEQALNEFLLPRFGPDVTCEFDYSGVLAFQDVMLSQAKAYVIATGAPILSVGEARKRLGFPVEPEPGDGELLVPFNLMPAGADQTKEPRTPANEDGDTGSTPDEGDEPAAETASRRDRMRKLADRDLRRHERMFRRGLSPFFQRQEERVTHRLREMGQRKAERPVKRESETILEWSNRIDEYYEQGHRRVIDVDSLLEDSPGDRELARKLIRAVVEERGQEVIDELATEVSFAAFTESADEFVATKGARLVRDVNATTRKALRETLSDGIANDESMGELIDRVHGVFNDRRGNAATIARTETAAAYNFATLEAYEQGGIETKEWLSAHDDAVRESHAEADGQVVPVSGVFTLYDDAGGVWECDYPGDPALPPDLSINCRCTMVPGPIQRKRKPSQNGNGKVHVLTLEEVLA